MRYLLLISAALWLLSCSGPYKAMRKVNSDLGCVQSFKPFFTTALYNTKVNVTGRHLSGLLMIKTMPDSSIRIVFSNEAGFKFFDFGFLGNGFKVYYIYKKMDKKAVIKTLRKDFQLLLMNNLDSADGYLFKKNHYNYYTFPQGKDHYYYITDSLCQKLVRMERGNRYKPVMTAVAANFNQGMPDTIGITHSNFDFNISLKRIYNYAEK
ncbi:MAG: hypothetical protein JWM28_1846 [Chitinophagaceae bacterium]|nr:hypothetical protein [Chitinophagaceae bacterium]